MKKIFVLISCFVLLNSLVAQDTLLVKSGIYNSDSLCIDNGDDVSEDVNYRLMLTIDSLNREFAAFRQQYSRELRNKQKVIRDTIVVHSDEHIVSSIDSLACELTNLGNYNNSSMDYIKHSVFKVSNSIFVVIILLSVLLLLLCVCLFFTLRSALKINKAISAIYSNFNEHSEVANKIETAIGVVHNKLNECKYLVNANQNDKNLYDVVLYEIKELKEMVYTMQKIIDSNKKEVTEENEVVITVCRPTLESYNNCVFEFIKLNDHIHSLGRRETRTLILALYRYLAKQETDKNEIFKLIRDCNLVEDKKEQFITIVDEIENFLGHKMQIINNWLQCELDNEIKSYEEAVRFPIGQQFDSDMDRDILGDDLSGQIIIMVHKLGFYFPGNTIKSYREKSIVSV